MEYGYNNTEKQVENGGKDIAQEFFHSDIFAITKFRYKDIIIGAITSQSCSKVALVYVPGTAWSPSAKSK